MLTPIQLDYLGNPSRIGGRPEVTDTQTVSCFWIPDMKIGPNGSLARQRAIDQGAEVEAIFVVEEMLHPLEDQRFRVIYNSITYQPVGVVPAPPDLGLEGTYSVYLKQWKVTN